MWPRSGVWGGRRAGQPWLQVPGLAQRCPPAAPQASRQKPQGLAPWLTSQQDQTAGRDPTGTSRRQASFSSLSRGGDLAPRRREILRKDNMRLPASCTQALGHRARPGAGTSLQVHVPVTWLSSPCPELLSLKGIPAQVTQGDLERHSFL